MSGGKCFWGGKCHTFAEEVRGSHDVATVRVAIYHRCFHIYAETQQ